MELNKTATSHIELAQQLNQQVVDEFEQKLNEYKVLLDKWTKTLNELYAERQEKTTDLLRVYNFFLKSFTFFCVFTFLYIFFRFVQSI